MGRTGLGGLHACLRARLYPDEIAGVVLLESAHADDDLCERRLRFLPRRILRASHALGGAIARNLAGGASPGDHRLATSR